MSYTQEKFESYFSKMEDFQEIAARNGVALKELLMKKVGLDEELASALVKEWGNKKGGTTGQAASGGAASKELFESYLSDMGSFQKLADLQGVPLRDWLIKTCGIDEGTATALIKQWGPQELQKSTACWISIVIPGSVLKNRMKKNREAVPAPSFRQQQIKPRLQKIRAGKGVMKIQKMIWLLQSVAHQMNSNPRERP